MFSPSTRAPAQLVPVATSPLAESLPYISLDKTGRFLLGASYAASVVTVTAVGADGRVGRRAPAGDSRGPQRPFDTRRRDQPIRLRTDARQRCGLHVHVRCEDREARVEHAVGPADEARGRTTPFRHLRRQPVPVPVVRNDRGDRDVRAGRRDGSADRNELVSGLAPDNTLVPGAPRGGPPTRNLDRDIWAADIHLTPDGKFLYLSERTDSTLNVFSVDGATGKLTYRSTHATERQPRGFAIDPSGRFVVATGEKSDMISLYGIDGASGALRRAPSVPDRKRCELGRDRPLRCRGLTTTGWARHLRWRARRARAARCRWAP